MKRAEKAIISCAVTGSIQTPTMSRYLPITPDEIADQAIAAAEAGAAILHLHARDPETGRPTQDPAIFGRFLGRIKQQSHAILNITTGGGLGMSLDERLSAAKAMRPEIASMNMGSINFNISAAASKLAQPKFDWEKPYLEMTKDFILSNTFAQIERAMIELSETGTRFEFECYDVGHLYNLAYFMDRKLIEPPFFIQFIFGVLGGIGADPDNLAHMRMIADKLFGQSYCFSVAAAGRHQMNFATMSGLLGGHVRVGLEDSLYLGKGTMATSNADQVRKIRRILEDLSIEVATPEEARALLRTKGGDRVGF